MIMMYAVTVDSSLLELLTYCENMHKIILSKLTFAVKIRKTNMSLNSMIGRGDDQFPSLEVQLPLRAGISCFRILFLLNAYYNKDNKVKWKEVAVERE